MEKHVMNALDRFYYVPLLPDTALTCVLTGKNLYRSAEEFGHELGMPSIPVSTHDVARLNELLPTLHKVHTRESLSAVVDASL